MIVFAHGLEGGPVGRKVEDLRRRGFVVDSPDGSGQPLARRIELLERSLAIGDCLLIGSSYGGLAAAYLAERHPERLCGLLLLAPALCLSEPPVLDPDALRAPTGVATIVLHGRRDAIIPIEHSRAYVRRSGEGTELRELDDTHALAGSLDAIATAVRDLGGRPSD